MGAYIEVRDNDHDTVCFAGNDHWESVPACLQAIEDDILKGESGGSDHTQYLPWTLEKVADDNNSTEVLVIRTLLVRFNTDGGVLTPNTSSAGPAKQYSPLRSSSTQATTGDKVTRRIK